MSTSETSRSVPVIAAGIGLLLALAASIFLVAFPCSVRTSSTTRTVMPADPDGLTRVEVLNSNECRSLLEAEGSSVLILLSIPATVTAGGMLSIVLRYRVVMWVLTLILFGFVAITGLSIGPYFLPTVIAMLAAAMIVSATSRESDENAGATMTAH